MLRLFGTGGASFAGATGVWVRGVRGVGALCVAQGDDRPVVSNGCGAFWGGGPPPDTPQSPMVTVAS